MSLNVLHSTYIINLKKRTDRRAHILEEFKDFPEFNIRLVEPLPHQSAVISLWNTMKHIVRDLTNDTDDYILICEDDHQFTEDYSNEFLIRSINEAKDLNADILLGGVSAFKHALSVSPSLCWVEGFNATQFVIVYRKFFEEILNADFNEYDSADRKLSAITTNQFFINPFISVQKDFGYSDATNTSYEDGMVESLFKSSLGNAKFVKKVTDFYNTLQHKNDFKYDADLFADFSIPTYVINLQERTDRKKHTEEQFKDKDEFDLSIVNACKHKNGTIGLWQTLLEIIKMAIENEDEFIIICEDDHEFTTHYSRDYLFRNIIEAHMEGSDLLSGGIASGFSWAIPVSDTRFWINHFFGNQFITIYKSFFETILESTFDGSVGVDEFLSKLTVNKMTMYPFISVQRNFGYSDIVPGSGASNYTDILFNKADDTLAKLKNTYICYKR